MKKVEAASTKKLGLNEKRVRLSVARAFVSGKTNFLVPAGEYVIRYMINMPSETPYCVFADMVGNDGNAVGAPVEDWGVLAEKKLVEFI